MIQVIHGKKGSGKTKRILEMANAAIQEHRGDVVFLDDDNRYMFDLRHEVRFVNAGEYGSDSPEMFFGFLCGMLAQNFDISVIFVDAFLKLICIQAVREFTFDGSVIALARIFTLRRDFLGIRCVQFQHGCLLEMEKPQEFILRLGLIN